MQPNANAKSDANLIAIGETDIWEFLGSETPWVKAEKDWGRSEKEMVDASRRKLEAYRARQILEYEKYGKNYIEETMDTIHDHECLESTEIRQWRKLDHAIPGFEFFVRDLGNGFSGHLIVTTKDHGDETLKIAMPIAAVINGTTYVMPEYRGRGIGKNIVLAAAMLDTPKILSPVGYSVMGFMSRLSAFAEAKRHAGLDPTRDIEAALRFLPKDAPELSRPDVKERIEIVLRSEIDVSTEDLEPTPERMTMR
ncbi:MAG: hypothetical protein ING19_11620 [Azospirillum sp.]|nr:hypothetical protein [Azospirillum sp.]